VSDRLLGQAILSADSLSRSQDIGIPFGGCGIWKWLSQQAVTTHHPSPCVSFSINHSGIARCQLAPGLGNRCVEKTSRHQVAHVNLARSRHPAHQCRLRAAIVHAGTRLLKSPHRPAECGVVATSRQPFENHVLLRPSDKDESPVFIAAACKCGPICCLPAPMGMVHKFARNVDTPTVRDALFQMVSNKGKRIRLAILPDPFPHAVVCSDLDLCSTKCKPLLIAILMYLRP